jgi:hypothetical protein
MPHSLLSELRRNESQGMGMGAIYLRMLLPYGESAFFILPKGGFNPA